MNGNSTKLCLFGLGRGPKPILDSPRLRRWWTKPLLASCSVALLTFVVIALVGPVASQIRTGDPLGLVIGYDVTTLYSQGEDIWEVWICESPDSSLELSASEVAALLESEMVPYFDWLSSGRYSPVFRAGDPGKVTAPGFASCFDAIEDLSKPGTEGVIALVNREADFAQGDPGEWSVVSRPGTIDTIGSTATNYPDNGRNVFGGSNLVTLPPGQTDGTPPSISILAHELGHGLWFPHSYRFDPDDYDNPMDIMSDAEVAPGLQVGTIAFNRYAAGWIDQEEVEVYSGGRHRYTLAPTGVDGTQMLVIRSVDDGFLTLGARVKKGYDSGLPKEGVESYYIYTENPDCGPAQAIPPCFGLYRSTQAVVPTSTVPLDYFDSVSHVMDVGGGLIYGDISVSLVERNGDNFVVEVTDEPLNTGVISDDAPPPSNVKPLPGFHEVDYDADPLNLIAGFDATTAYTLDNDLWEVWICRAPDGYLDISAEGAVNLLTSKLVPYFTKMSGGRYQPVFRVGGSVSVDYDSDWEYGNCDSEVDKAVRSRALNPQPEGLIKIIDTHVHTNVGNIGDTDHNIDSSNRTPSSPVALQASRSPDNNRDIHLSGAIVATPDAVPSSAVINDPYLTDDQLQWLSIAAHELGHSLGFPHSQMFREYDNPMDVMSRANDQSELGVGTIAINRYAAGWIDPSEVAIFDGQSTNRYWLSPPGGDNTQMLIIKSNGSGYLTLGTRIQKGLDSLIPKEGVEVYLVDEQSLACPHFFDCIWNSRHTRAAPTHSTIPPGIDRVAHVMDVGDGFTTWNNISVTVVERNGDDFIVEVSRNWFTDDDGNVHEDNIETIAAMGVSVGCGDPEDNLYCPSRTVTRAQMATFLIRALDETAEENPRVSRFSDVPPGAWYLGYVERLADLNIARAETGGAFRPSDPLTRLEMAVWMTRAFDSVNEVSPQGVFNDVPADAQHAGAVEGIRAAGITKGCSTEPPAYCPDNPVRRDQMASFLGRALTAQGS